MTRRFTSRSHRAAWESIESFTPRSSTAWFSSGTPAPGESGDAGGNLVG